MADATTATTELGSNDPGGLAIQIANGVTVYKGRFAGVRGPSHATTQGYADSYNDEAGMFFAGVFDSADGLASAAGDTTASPPPKAAIPILPRLLLRVTVTGASSMGDILKPVYATDNQTLTLTRPAAGTPVGCVTYWHTSTTVDILLFGWAVQFAIDLGGGGQELMNLGSYDCATITAANLRTGIPMPYHGAFLEVFAMIDVAPAGSAGTALINLEIGGTNVTGGVVTVATGDSKADKKAGTAVTALSVFHEGDLLDVEAATVTSMSAGRFDLFATVERRPGV